MCEEVNKDTADKGVVLLLNDEIIKLNDRLSAMGKFMSENNKLIVNKLEEISRPIEVDHSEQQDQLFTALCRAKSNIKPDFEKTGYSNRGSSATLPDMVYHTGPALYAEGLEILQEPVERGNYDYLKTTITHSSGQWRSSVCAIRPDYEKGSSSGLQCYASALTSMKRYVYGAILNLHTGGDKE